MSDRQLDLFQTTGSAWSECQPDLLAIYRVDKVGKRFCASVLTEAGTYVFPKDFGTIEAARRRCERDARKWRRQRRFAAALRAA